MQEMPRTDNAGTREGQAMTTNELMIASLEIGAIHSSNPNYTEGIARKVDATGKPLAALTVGKLMQIIKEHNAAYNRMYS
jgi:hypothetical protein